MRSRSHREGSWTDAQRAVLQIVDDLYTDDCASDATWARATKHFDEPDIVHLLPAATCYRTVIGLLNSCGVELDDGVPGADCAGINRVGGPC